MRYPISMAEACQSEACALQTCLNKNTYAPEKCDNKLRELYTCCQTMYEKAEGQTVQPNSTACPMRNVVERWMKDHPRERKK
ncbi:Cx9C motif-containing protein 4, mitochondrial [Favolaschia claudopus]|uniref:Cx9C motif-containing protein 4, mitochondrial n=1 Tax=Favolaschia claudopus TaxID=2862362 RepID=A0AAW0DHF1_9AGAR